jgi:hypothetical protein
MTPPDAAIERAPRWRLWHAMVAYAAAALALGYPALWGKFLVNPRSDQFIAGYAFREFAAATLRETGSFPLWNPYLFGGLPYVAAMHGDIFYPTFLLRLVLPTDAAMTWGFVIHLFLAGVFCHLFLRAAGISFLGALAGGLAYMLGGNVAALVSPGHDGKLYIATLTPLLLLLVLRGVRDGKAWSWGALALVTGLAVLTPHPQLLQYMLLLAGAFALFTGMGTVRQGLQSASSLARRLGMGALALALGGAIGAIQFLPVREYVAWSPRAGGKSWELATQFSLPPEEIVNFYLPHFSGILDHYWGRNGIHLHSEYLGAAVILLAGLAFVRLRNDPRRGQIVFWAITFLVSLAWAMGGFTPFYRLVYAVVPGTKYFRAPSTILFVVGFSVAVLTAHGMERVLRKEIGRRYLVLAATLVALIALLGFSGALTNLAVAVAQPGAVDFAMANDAAIRLGSLRSTLFAALALLVLYLVMIGRMGRQGGAILLATILAADLWTVERHYWQFSEPAERIFASDSTIEYIKAQAAPGRVLPLASNAVDRDPFLRGDALMVHRIRSALGYHGNELRYYQMLGDKNNGWRNLIVNPNIWHLLNIRYVLTDVEDLGVPTLRRVVGPVKNAYGTTVHLFETVEENPAAWVVPVIVKAEDGGVLATLLDPRFDVRRAALFSPDAPVRGSEIEQLPPALDVRAHVVRYAPGEIEVQLDRPAPRGAALMMSENYYPGWRATVDGKPAALGRADYSLIGIELPEGGRRISLSFSSRSYETGRSVTMAALLVALAWWVLGWLMELRRRG